MSVETSVVEVAKLKEQIYDVLLKSKLALSILDILSAIGRPIADYPTREAVSSLITDEKVERIDGNFQIIRG